MTKVIKRRNFYLVDEFFEVCVKLKFASRAEYYAFAKDKDNRLPKTPDAKYGDAFIAGGGWDKVLSGKAKPYPFEEFVVVCRTFGFINFHDYQKRYRLDPRLPAEPDMVYKNSGWNEAGKWLCVTGKKKSSDNMKRSGKRKKIPPPVFEDFLKICQKHKILSRLDYFRRHEESDESLPCSPNNLYGEEWKKAGGWSCVSVGRIKFDFYDFETFLLVCKAMKFKSRADYAARRHLDKKLPSSPDVWYGELWKQNGYTRCMTGEKFFSFKDFILACKKLNITSSVDYRNRYKLIDGLPCSPETQYGKYWKEIDGWKFVISLIQS